MDKVHTWGPLPNANARLQYYHISSPFNLGTTCKPWAFTLHIKIDETLEGGRPKVVVWRNTQIAYTNCWWPSNTIWNKHYEKIHCGGNTLTQKMIHLISVFFLLVENFALFEKNWKEFVANLMIKKKELPIFKNNIYIYFPQKSSHFLWFKVQVGSQNYIRTLKSFSFICLKLREIYVGRPNRLWELVQVSYLKKKVFLNF